MSEWVERSLGELVGFQKGRKVETWDYPTEDCAPYLGAGAISGSYDGYAACTGAVLAKPTDILMLWDGERSGLSCTGLSGVVASTVSKLTPSSEIDSDLLSYILKLNFEWIQNRRTGTGVPHVPKDLGRILSIKFPSEPSEQRAIVRVLQTVDQAIEKTEQLIEKYQQIKAGLMHDLFIRGIGADGQLRPPREQAPGLYQHTLIGWIPKEWDISSLGELARIVSGITLGSNLPRSGGVLVPYLRVANVQDGYLDLSEVKSIRVEAKTLDNLRLEHGDVLMNEGGDFDKLGRGTVWQSEIKNCIHQNHVFRVRCIRQYLMPEYLAFYSQSVFGKKYFLISSKQSTNLASINSRQLHAFPIALAAIGEQEMIVERLNASNSRINGLKAELEKLLKQKSGLMHDLLTGMVPVSVDSASEATA
jgi:type I restriction enzyme S subunit